MPTKEYDFRENLGEGRYRIKSEEYPTDSTYEVEFVDTNEMRFVRKNPCIKYMAGEEITIERSEEVYIRTWAS